MPPRLSSHSGSSTSGASTSLVYNNIAKAAGYHELATDGEHMKRLLAAATFRALHVVRLAADASGKSSTVREEHVRLLARLTPLLGGCSGHGARAAGKHMNMRGGYSSTTLPSSYFTGEPNTVNYQADAPTGHQPWSGGPEGGLARTGLRASFDSFGGGATKNKQQMRAGAAASPNKKKKTSMVRRRMSTQAGGSTVLPSEYFTGQPSGNYFEPGTEGVDVTGHQPWSGGPDGNLARTGLTADDTFAPSFIAPGMPGQQCGGGGSTLMTDSMFTGFVKEFNERTRSRLRLSDGAKTLLKRVVVRNVVLALREAGTSHEGTSTSTSTTRNVSSSSSNNKPLTAALVDAARSRLRICFTLI